MCDAITRNDQPAFNPEAISTRSPTVSTLRITRPVTPPPVLLRRYDTSALPFEELWRATHEPASTERRINHI